MTRNELRRLLNTLFLLGCLVAMILYLALPDDRTAFLVAAFISMGVKVAEYIVRFFR